MGKDTASGHLWPDVPPERATKFHPLGPCADCAVKLGAGSGKLIVQLLLCFMFTPHPEPLCRKPVRCIGEPGKEVHCGEETTSVSAELPWVLAGWLID